jgi:hypothetical protein
MRSFPYLSLAVLALVGCGDDAPANPDAPDVTDAAPDAPQMMAGCDYSELQDATNDDLTSATGVPETTGKTLTGAITLCGQIDNTHYDATEGLVDVDGFAVMVPTGPIRVTVSGPGVEALRDVMLEISTGADFANVWDRSELLGTHVFYMDPIEAGLYQFAVIAGNATAPAAPLPYKIVITADDPSTRCPKITTAADFTEAGDGAGSRGNDVYGVNYAAMAPATVYSLTPAGNDMSEPTALTINPGDARRLTGSLAEIAVDGSYKDRDSFVFTTGANTDQVTMRINWTGTADLDAFLFEAGVVPRIGNANMASTMEAEFKTIAVKPSTMYAVWTGLDRTSTGPIAYSISLCGSDFTHPTN